MKQVIALFGESEKGQLKTPYCLKTLPELMDFLGHPPPESEGLFLAVQALLYERELIYFRVEEEGFSVADYLAGLRYLEDLKKIRELGAVCLPGVSNDELIQFSLSVCEIHRSSLIMNEKDLYDYLMQ